MIYQKTSILIEASSYCACLLRKGDSCVFREFGKNLGLSFQIVDDILDITSNDDILGKPSFSDFKEGKTTLPYIYLYHSLNKEEKEVLKSFRAKDLSEDERGWILSRFEKHGCIQRAYEYAKMLSQKASIAIKDSGINLDIFLQKALNRSF